MESRNPSKKQTSGSMPTSSDARPPDSERRARQMGRLDAHAEFPTVPKGAKVTVVVRNRSPMRRRKTDAEGS